MKPQPWFWHGEEAAMFVGHEITKADALRLASVLPLGVIDGEEV